MRLPLIATFVIIAMAIALVDVIGRAAKRTSQVSVPDGEHITTPTTSPPLERQPTTPIGGQAARFTDWITDAAMIALLRKFDSPREDDAALRQRSRLRPQPRSAFALPWRWNATHCLPESRMHLDEFGDRLGVLPELESLTTGDVTVTGEPLAVRASECFSYWPSMNATSKLRMCGDGPRLKPRPLPVPGRDRAGCGTASRGVWHTPFATSAFAELANATFPELTEVLAKLGGPSNQSSSAPSASPPTLEQVIAGIAARGEKEQWRLDVRQAAMTLVLALSRLPPTQSPVVTTTASGATTEMQSFVRVLLPGSSYARGQFAKAVALMRGMAQHYDQRIHTMIRYVFTSHGDYYVLLPRMAHVTEVPIRLAIDPTERVFFELVFEFQWQDKLCRAGRRPTVALWSSTTRDRNATIPFSAIFVRAVISRNVAADGARTMSVCATATLAHLRQALVPSRGMIVQYQTPLVQMQIQDASPAQVMAREAHWLDTLRAMMVRRSAAASVANVTIVAAVPAAWDVIRADGHGHGQCILKEGYFTTPILTHNCEDAASAQVWWYFSLAALLGDIVVGARIWK